MKTKINRSFLCLNLLLFILSFINLNVFAQANFEGFWEAETIIKSTLSMQPAKKVGKEKSFYKNGKMKVVKITENEEDIFDFAQGFVLSIDHNKKTYSIFRFDQMQAEMKKTKNRMSDAMKDMDPEQREMMKKMMGGKMGAMMGGEESLAISIKHTGKTRTIKGYRCKQIIMNMGDKPMMEMWMTNKFNLGNDIIKMYQKMGMIKSDIPKDEKLKGFPIYTKTKLDMGMGKTETETTVTKIVKTSVSDDEFKAPKGYRQIDKKMEF